jgi:hypothetical protein
MVGVQAMKTTGPVLAIGAITMANNMLFNGQPFDWRVPVATAISAGAFALAEKAWPEGATALAWMALVTILIARVNPKVPSPVETLNNWWKSTQ